MKRKMEVPVFKCAARALAGLFESPSARQATAYHSPTIRATATRPYPTDRRASRETIIVTIGKPNFEQTKFVKACIKAKEPFPIWKVQLKFWPKKKKK